MPCRGCRPKHIIKSKFSALYLNRHDASHYGETKNYVAVYAWYSVATATDNILTGQKLATLKADLTLDDLAVGKKIAAELPRQINVRRPQARKFRR